MNGKRKMNWTNLKMKKLIKKREVEEKGGVPKVNGKSKKK